MVDQPDVSEMNRIAMILEQDRQGIGAFRRTATSLVFEFEIVLHDHAVVSNGDATLRDSLSGGVELGRREVDVVRLPS